MKRLLIGLLLAAGLTFGTFADGIFDVEAGLRSIDFGGPVPSLGISIGRDSELVLDVYKKDFWPLQWQGTYALDAYASLRSLTWLYVDVGVQKPIVVEVDPLTFPETPLFLSVGLRFHAGYPADVFVRTLFEGAHLHAIEAGFHVGLVETLQRIFGGPTAAIE